MSEGRPRRILILGATSAIAIAVVRELIAPMLASFSWLAMATGSKRCAVIC